MADQVTAGEIRRQTSSTRAKRWGTDGMWASGLMLFFGFCLHCQENYCNTLCLQLIWHLVPESLFTFLKASQVETSAKKKIFPFVHHFYQCPNAVSLALLESSCGNCGYDMFSLFLSQFLKDHGKNALWWFCWHVFKFPTSQNRFTAFTYEADFHRNDLHLSQEEAK